MQGWVSIHRKIMNNPVWQDPKLLKLWMLCLLEATHKEHEQLVGKQIIKLQPGQFVTGRFSLSKAFNEGAKKVNLIEERTLWRWMKMLETYDFLSINSNTKYSVITIKNWYQYQQNEGQTKVKQRSNEGQKVENMTNKIDPKNIYISTNSSIFEGGNVQPMSSQCPADVQPMSTNNNGNNVNNENKEINNNTNDSKRILEFWDSNGFGFANTNAKQKLLMFLDEGLEVDVILRALEIACESNKISYSYVERILIDWSNRGLTTLKAVQAAEAEFKRQKQKPARSGKHSKPIRQEMVPEYMDQEYIPPTVDVAAEAARKQAIQDKLNQFRK